MTRWAIRPAHPADMGPLARLWHGIWHEVHADIVPAPLAAIRRPEVFTERLKLVGRRLRVAGPIGAPVGLCIINGNRIDHLYVSPEVRGSGLAKHLLDDGISRLWDAGVRLAELDCAADNTRAARFYENSGWRNCGQRMVPVETSQGSLLLSVLLFEKDLAFNDPA